MEEILASIRRIVVEESDAPARDDDVLDLTDVVDAEGNVVARESAASGPLPSAGPPPPWPDTPLVSPSVEAEVARAFRRAGPDAPPPADADDRVIEDHLRAMLQPMLREWLDKHLPGIVERLVQGEIARIARRSGPG